VKIPAKLCCDLCGVEITGRHVQMAYPLDEADVARLEATLPAQPRVFAFLPIPRPNAWRFDFCRGCADGFMPMLDDLKAKAIAAYLEERARQVADAETDVDA